METDSKLYGELCKSYNIQTDEKVLAALSISGSTGELSLPGTSLSNHTCEIISKLLPQSKVIVKLDFSDCLLPPLGLTALLNTVCNSKVQSLQLKGNNINVSTTVVLARLIAKSTQIKMLGLEWNNIGVCSDAVEQFCSALSKNSCIEILDLRNNQLDAECALHLANALRNNVTLRALDIRWNCIEQEGAQYFLSAFHLNKTLTSLKVTGNSVPNDLATALELATKHNLSLYRVKSECDARTQLLARHVRVISEQRSQELKLWADKSQQNLRETEGRLQELEAMLATKQNRIVELEAEKAALETDKVRLKEIEKELEQKGQQLAEAKKENENFAETLKKTKTDYESDIAKLQATLKSERDRETQRADEAELQVQRALQEIKSLKERIGTIQVSQNENLEAERKLFSEQLERAEKNFESRLSDVVNEAQRTKQAMQDKIILLETTVETLERSKTETNAQLLTERTKWKEEKSVLLNEAREKEEYKVSLLNEKLEHAKEDKASLEGQLGNANSTIAQMHRENATMMAELGEASRKLLHLQEEISTERLVVQRLRLEKNEDLRSLEAAKSDSEKLRNEITTLERNISEMNLSHEKMMNKEKLEKEKILHKLESKEKEISAIRVEEAERVSQLFTAFNKYFGGLPKA